MDTLSLTEKPKKKQSRVKIAKSSSSSEESNHEVKKKSKKDSKEKKHKKKDKKDKKKKPVAAEPEPEIVTKKRKAEEVSKKPSDTVEVKKVAEWLHQLSIPFDAHKLGKLKRHQERNYNELVNVMSDATLKGLIYQFTVKTPIGRLFWYSAKEDRFKNVREEYNLIKLRDFGKETALNMPEVQKGLTSSQRKAALECLGLTESDIVSPENWLFALIETGVLEKALQKPLSPQPIEAVLFHDTHRKESYWISSIKGKQKLSQAIVTRTRTIHENNLQNEIASLAKKRKDIQHLLEKLDCTPSTSTSTIPVPKKANIKKGRDSSIAAMKTSFEEAEPPKKKKKVKVVEMDIEPPKPKLTPAQLKQEIINSPKIKALLASSSSDGSLGSSSTSSDCSSSDEEADKDAKTEARLKAAMLEKQRKGTYKGTSDPLATPISKSIEVKKNIDDAKRHKKILDDITDPEIKFFRTHCT